MKRHWLPVFAAFGWVVGGSTATADVKFDGTTGAAQTLSVSPFQITKDLGHQTGPNLFHSFERFSLATGEVAVFSGADGIQNILARVTGSAASSIDGTIHSTANLFLINPRGWIFGPHASLQVDGSFVATTADYVRMGSAGRFDASHPDQTQFSVAPPSAFGFLAENSGAIAVSSETESFGVKAGRSLALIGGDVTLKKTSLDAPGGAIHVVSARGPGQVQLDFSAARPAPTFAAGVAGGAVQIEDSRLSRSFDSAASRVVIRGGKLTLADSKVDARATAAGDGIVVQAMGDLQVGNTEFLALADGDFSGRAVIEVGAKTASLSRGTSVTVQPSAVGTKGDVQMAIDEKLDLSGISVISSSTDSRPGGDVRISAGALSVSSGSGMLAQSFGSGAGGDLHLEVGGRLELLSGGHLTVEQSSAKASDLFVSARDLFISGQGSGTRSGIYANLSSSEGNPSGSVRLALSGKLEMHDGAFIQANTLGGDGVKVDISAREVLIANDGGASETGIAAGNSAPSGGRAGSIRLTVQGPLSLLGGAAINTNTLGLGPGGDIDITAHGVLVEGMGTAPTAASGRGISARNETAGPSGPSGNVRIAFGDTLQVRRGGEILATTVGSGRGGNIRLSGHDALISTDSRIAAETLATARGGVGGNVTLVLAGTLALSGGSQISVKTAGSGMGGSTNIHAGAITLSGKETGILATTAGSGRGGSITLVGNQATISDRSRIAAETTAAGEAGAGGDLHLALRDRFSIAGGGSVSVASLGSGAGGNIELRTGVLAIAGANSALLATANGAGAGGNIAITGESAALTLGGRIAAETTAPRGGPGGSVRLDFHDTLDLTGGARISVATHGAGMGGNIDVGARALTISGRGSAITAQSLGSPAGGAGGNISLQLETLSLSAQAAILVSSAGSGRAGTITIDAQDRVLLADDSSIAAAAPQSTGGNIEITAGSQIAIENSQISATAAARGGNIRLVTRDLLRLFQSQVTAAATTDGGNIFIDPTFVFLDRSAISANAIVGRGGNIDLISDFLIASPDSAVTASSERGISGRVTIDAINVDLTGNLVELPADVTRAESLLRALCTVKLRDFSSLIMEGRGGLAPAPGEPLPSLEPEWRPVGGAATR